MIRVVHPGSGSWFFTHPGSRSQKGTWSRIRNTLESINKGGARLQIHRYISLKVGHLGDNVLNYIENCDMVINLLLVHLTFFKFYEWEQKFSHKKIFGIFIWIRVTKIFQMVIFITINTYFNYNNYVFKCMYLTGNGKPFRWSWNLCRLCGPVRFDFILSRDSGGAHKTHTMTKKISKSIEHETKSFHKPEFETRQPWTN